MVSVPELLAFQYMALSHMIFCPAVVETTMIEALPDGSLSDMLYVLRELAAMVSEKNTFPCPVDVR